MIDFFSVHAHNKAIERVLFLMHHVIISIWIIVILITVVEPV